MDRHDNLALSAAPVLTPQHAATRENDSDRQSLHRLFRDMRRAIGAPPSHLAALPHP